MLLTQSLLQSTGTLRALKEADNPSGTTLPVRSLRASAKPVQLQVCMNLTVSIDRRYPYGSATSAFRECTCTACRRHAYPS